MLLVAGSVATAPSDGTRLSTGFTRGCGPSCGIVEGPFVLTDARTLETSTTQNTWIYTVPSGTDCTPISCSAGGLQANASADPLIALTTRVPATFPSLPNAISGARYFIPAGRRLCACGEFNQVVRVSWAGFVPYQ